MVIAVDFDGVIHDFRNPLPGRKMGPPIFGAKEALEYWHRQGTKIHVYTIWPVRSHGVICEWMDYYGIPFDFVTNVKGPADAYIDDKAVRFTDWQETLERANRLLSGDVEI